MTVDKYGRYCSAREEFRWALYWLVLLVASVVSTIWITIYGTVAPNPIPWFVTLLSLTVITVLPTGFFTWLQWEVWKMARDEERKEDR